MNTYDDTIQMLLQPDIADTGNNVIIDAAFVVCSGVGTDAQRAANRVYLYVCCHLTWFVTTALLTVYCLLVRKKLLKYRT